MNKFEFVIPGKPYPLKRPRRASFGGMFDPKENTEAKALVAQIARLAIRRPIEGPVVLCATFLFERPKSHYGKSLKASAPIFHTQRPDVDNLIKTVLDGLNGIAWKDDAQVVEVRGRKEWSDGAAQTNVGIETFKTRGD
jgi:Holliday junction resolvase RusA-like endonuclease